MAADDGGNARGLQKSNYLAVRSSRQSYTGTKRRGIGRREFKIKRLLLR